MCVGMEALLLDTQYRMHPHICVFPSQVFYRGALKTAKRCHSHVLPRGFASLGSKDPVVFVPHFCGELLKREPSNADRSFQNDGEAEIVVQLVQQLLLLPQDVQDIAVLTPYRGQLNLLQKRMPARNGIGSQISISTIDGFQVGNQRIYSSAEGGFAGERM